MNFVQVFREPYPAATSRSIDEAVRAIRFCSFCGRERGARATCDGCGAPSVLSVAPAASGPVPYTLEWWAERSPVFGVPRSDHAGAGSYPYPLRIFEDDGLPEGEFLAFSGQVGFDPNAPFPLHEWDPRRGVRVTGF